MVARVAAVLRVRHAPGPTTMAEGWFEVRAVVRCDRDVLDKAWSWLEGSDLVEVNRVDITPLDDDLRRWDGGRPPGVVVDLAPGLGMPEPALTPHPVFDSLRRGHHVDPE